MSARRRVAVVGGGLVGSLVSIYLSRRGYAVELLEKRPDMRLDAEAGGRSINLVVTSRGIRGLRQVDLWDKVSAISVPVTGRMMHGQDGSTSYQPYGRDESESNYSVSRGGLNRLLLSEAEAAGVTVRFDRPLRDVDPEHGRLRFDDGTDDTQEYDVVLGADGAASVVRAALARRDGFEQSVELLDHGYKELLIPAASGGAYPIEKHVLHIWPRGRMMLMALPNLHGSFTVTLYLPFRGEGSFEGLNAADAVQQFFQRQFPDAVPLIPDLQADFQANPTGELGTVRCAPWHVGGRAALIGDAAHAVVPFFGQGMNCGFEDCTVLDGLLDEHGDDWAEVLPRYSAERKPNADAIADMALDNFVEMSDRVGDPGFLLRKKVEHRLELEMPELYRSRYSMVVYSHIPYALAQQAGEIQRGILEQLCDGLRSEEELDLGAARRLIAERLSPFLKSRSARLDY